MSASDQEAMLEGQRHAMERSHANCAGIGRSKYMTELNSTLDKVSLRAKAPAILQMCMNLYQQWIGDYPPVITTIDSLIVWAGDQDPMNRDRDDAVMARVIVNNTVRYYIRWKMSWNNEMTVTIQPAS